MEGSDGERVLMEGVEGWTDWLWVKRCGGCGGRGCSLVVVMSVAPW